MQQSSSNSENRPRVVLFQSRDNSLGAESELDLDLYDTDEVPDSPTQQHPGISFCGLPSILDHDADEAPRPPQYARAAPTREAQPSDVASMNRSHQETASSVGGSSSTRRLYRNKPANPHPTIRTNFTAAASGVSHGDGSSTPQHYDHMVTPPSNPGVVRPEELIHPAFSQSMRTEMSMRTEWMIGLSIVGLGLGITIESQSPTDQIAYWFTTIGDLYVRMTTCVTLPMAFCQVVTCSAELINSDKLRRTWRYTILYFALTAFLTSWLGIITAIAFQSHFERHAPKDYRLSHPKFAFKCANEHYLELQPDGDLACTGTDVSKNTTFPRMIDVNQRLGLEDTVANVNINGYVFAMVDIFFPQNIVKALAEDNYVSAMIVAVVVGVAIGKSYTCPAGEIRRSRNPLFRLFTHVYLSLFAMNEWIQRLALWATVPILIGAVLSIPNVKDTLSLARYYIAAALVSGFGQSLFVVPLVYYITMRQNPYRWIQKTLCPISYGMILQNAFVSLPMATKAALRSNEISPTVFGAVYPVLTAVNRSHSVVGLPTAILYVAAFSGCSIEMNVSNTFVMAGITFLGCFGTTMLPRSGMAYFLMAWRTFCENEDTPSSVLMIATLGILIYRLGACVGTMTDLLLMRMVAHAIEKEDNKLQQLVDEAFHHRESVESSTPIASPPST